MRPASLRTLFLATSAALSLLPSVNAQAAPRGIRLGSASAPAPASAQVDRIPASADLSPRSRMAGHVPRWATSAADRGAVPDATRVELIFNLARSPEMQAAFDQLLADQQSPSSPRYHHWLTPEQIGEQFGPTQNDLDAVSHWLAAEGLQVGALEPSRIFLHASGSAAVVSAAFQTSLHSFARSTRTLQAPTAEPSIPSALSPLIAFVGGLAEIDYRSHLHQSAPVPISQTNIRPLNGAPSASAPVRPDVTFSNGGHLLGPADFATIFDVNAVYSANIKGNSQKVAIIGGSRLGTSDLSTWESLSGLPSYQPNYIVPSGPGYADPGLTADGNQVEGTLDFERVFGTAPAASVDQIISTNWLNGTTTYNLILYAINTVKDPVLSLSFGACEAEQTPSFLSYENTIFSQAAAQGIGVFASSGDSGVAGCEASGGTPASNPTASISDICSSAYVTCVGGTEFSDTANPSAYWSSTNTQGNLESALGYIPEGAWNEPTCTLTNSAGGCPTGFTIAATGGGPSTFTAKPSFQVGAGVPADGVRDVPDVSFPAALHDGYFSCLAFAGADCTTYVEILGGTSASAPAMAGVAALLNQKLGAPQGNLNATLYRVATSTPAAFHDATPATSGVSSCSTATASTCNNSDPAPSSRTGGLAGFALTTGFDLSTGLGSLDVNAFLAAAAPPALAATAETLTASPTTITTAQTTIFTAAISSSTTGTPSGTVQFSSNGATLGSAVALVNGHASSPAQTFASAATYTITAAYSGDTAFAASSATLAFTVTTPVVPLTTTSLMGTAGTGTITTQGSVSYTASVTSTASGTPTGTVQFIRTSGSTPTNIGTPVPLSAGRATIPAFSLPAGIYTITAAYSGDSNFTGSTSQGVSLTVTAIPTTTTIPAAAQAVTSTQQLFFTATIAPAASNSAAPTGTVQFTVDGLPRGTPVTLSGNTASSTGLSFPPGGHTVAAVYSGDAIFASSTSASAPVTATITPTTTTFTPLPPTTLTSVGTTPLTATVSGLATIRASTASIIFMDGSNVLFTYTPPATGTPGTTLVAVDTQAGPLTVGTHNITAMFTGDTNYAPSTSPVATIVVTQAPNFTLAAASSTLTLASASSASGSEVITASTTNGFAGSINFACTVALTGGGTATVAPTCSVTPVSITFPGTATTTVSIGTIAPHVRSGSSTSLRRLETGGALAFAALLLSGLPLSRRKHTWRSLAGALLLTLSLGSLLALSGCGGGSSSTPPPPPSGGTTTGAYTVTITGTASTGIPPATTTFSLTVN